MDGTSQRIQASQTTSNTSSNYSPPSPYLWAPRLSHLRLLYAIITLQTQQDLLLLFGKVGKSQKIEAFFEHFFFFPWTALIGILEALNSSLCTKAILDNFSTEPLLDFADFAAPCLESPPSWRIFYVFLQLHPMIALTMCLALNYPCFSHFSGFGVHQ